MCHPLDPLFTPGTPYGWVFKCQTYSCWVSFFPFEPPSLGNICEIFIFSHSFGVIFVNIWYSGGGEISPRRPHTPTRFRRTHTPCPMKPTANAVGSWLHQSRHCEQNSLWNIVAPPSTDLEPSLWQMLAATSSPYPQWSRWEHPGYWSPWSPALACAEGRYDSLPRRY